MFHDGTPFNGDAVKKFFARTADPATKSGFAANLFGPYETTELTEWMIRCPKIPGDSQTTIEKDRWKKGRPLPF